MVFTFTIFMQSCFRVHVACQFCIAAQYMEVSHCIMTHVAPSSDRAQKVSWERRSQIHQKDTVISFGTSCREKSSVIANMSARVGSIGDNQLGGWYSYRASKTALNQLTKTMAIECTRRKTNVSCILLHPGTVDTDLSAPFQKVGLI